jgi:hypothetical protein
MNHSNNRIVRINPKAATIRSRRGAGPLSVAIGRVADAVTRDQRQRS